MTPSANRLRASLFLQKGDQIFTFVALHAQIAMLYLRSETQNPFLAANQRRGLRLDCICARCAGAWSPRATRLRGCAWCIRGRSWTLSPPTCATCAILGKSISCSHYSLGQPFRGDSQAQCITDSYILGYCKANTIYSACPCLHDQALICQDRRQRGAPVLYVWDSL